MSDLEQMRKERSVRKAAEYRKRRALAELRGEPVGPIPASPVRSRAKELIDLGWSVPAIIANARVDVTGAGLHLVVKGTSRRCNRAFEPIADLPVTLAVPDHLPDECMVPMLGATRRIRALMRLGWRHQDITPLLGGRTSHHISAGKFHQINAHDWRLVDLVFEKLSATDGPSDASRKRAADQGFAPPLAWDNIDNPQEQPRGLNICEKPDCQAEVVAKGMCGPHYRQLSIGGVRGFDGFDEVAVERILAGAWRLPSSPAERTEVCRRWAADGRSMNELGRLTGWATHRYWKNGAAA